MNRRQVLLTCGLLPTAALAFPAGVRPRPLVFPEDFGAHPDTRTEWWYLTGTLACAGREFGFQVTFFRSRTPLTGPHPSRFAAQQLVFAHAALTDLGERRLRHDQRLARAGFEIASTAEGDTGVVLRDWSLQRDSTQFGSAEASRYRAQVRSTTGGFAFDLQLATTQPVLLQGEAGFSRKSPDAAHASHYYSQPQLAVQGRLRLDGADHPVQGRAWLDHEWSDTLLDPTAMGWDWIGMNLDDGSALTAFRLRRADGSTLYAGGSLRAAGGTVRAFGPDDVRFSPQRTWRSGASQASYPVEWRLETPAGRHVVKALLDDQELDSRGSTGSFYWEGLSDLLDERGARVGRGYLEITGYAGRLLL